MLSFQNYFQQNNQEQRPWKQIPNREGLYALANPYVLDNQLYEELSQNLNPEHDSTYHSQSGWSYRVKIRDNGELGVIGWKARQQSGGQTGKSSSYGSKQPYQKGSTEAKQYVDVEVKHTENVSTVNEILSAGYMNQEMWRLQSIINMPELNEDGKVSVVPHYILVRKKEFVPQTQPAKQAVPIQQQQQSTQTSGMPE